MQPQTAITLRTAVKFIFNLTFDNNIYRKRLSKFDGKESFRFIKYKTYVGEKNSALSKFKQDARSKLLLFLQYTPNLLIKKFYVFLPVAQISYSLH